MRFPAGIAGHAALAFLTLTAPATAQTTRHVRADRALQRLIDDAAERSPAIRESLDRLERLDVTVYVRVRTFPQMDLDGRVALLSANGGHRYLVIELACGRSELTLMTTLGHELFHAVEIGEEPSVVSAGTLADFYSRIGTLTGSDQGNRTFDTAGAAAAGLRARRQLLTNTTRSGHGT